MKLMATRSFRNTGLKIKPDKSWPHEMHVPKGHQFSIGGDLPYEKLEKDDRDFVYLLNAAYCLCEPTPDNISKIEKELAEEKARQATDPGSRVIYK